MTGGWRILVAMIMVAGTLAAAGTAGVVGTAHAAGMTNTAQPAGKLKLTGRPGDPPIGVSLETLSPNSGAGIVINGQGVPDTYDRNGIFVVVLDRATRDVRQYGTTPTHGGGIQQLQDIANRFNDTTMMIISDTKGINRVDMGQFVTLAKRLGATVTTAEQNRLAAGASFSIIGSPGGDPGTAWVKVASLPDPDHTGGNITGYLQYNPPAGAYNYVSGQVATYDTAAAGSGGTTNVIEVNGTRYPGTLPEGNAGFEILVLDSRTLAQVSLTTVATTTASGQNAMAAALKAATRSSVNGDDPPPLVFVQSIGKPVSTSTGWTDAADAVEAMGATRLAFLNLQGDSDYTLVGSTGSPKQAVEAGTILGQPGPLTGMLTPGPDLTYQPVTAGAPGLENLQLARLLYQPATAWPSIDAAAETWLGRTVRLCASDAASCSFRRAFGDDYQASWNQIATDFNAPVTGYPGDGHGFTREQFSQTKQELASEISMFSQVKNYFTVLQDTFSRSSQDKRVDVRALGDQIYNAVKPPPYAVDVGAKILNILSKILALAGAVAPPSPVKAAIGGLSTAFGFISTTLSSEKGSTTFADGVRARADELTRVTQEQLASATDGMTTQARIVVTDYSKLRAASNYIAGSWKLPADPKEYVPPLQLVVKQWYAKALVPMAYPWMLRGTPPPLGPGDANGLSCPIYVGNWPFPDKRIANEHPWAPLPKNVQFRAIERWSGTAQVRPTFFFARRPAITAVSEREDWDLIMPQSLADTLFGSKRDQLGLNLYQFVSPRYFGAIHYANDAANRCDLF
jgi:hypothetical protein